MEPREVDENDGARRRLETPSRQPSRDGRMAAYTHGRSRLRSRSPVVSRSRDRSLSRRPPLKERELDLERRRELLRREEWELEREREESEHRRRRHEYRPRSGPSRGTVVEQDNPAKPRERVVDAAEVVPEKRQRSVSPVFSARDIFNLVNSFKDKSLPYRSVDQSPSLIQPEFNPTTKNQRMDTWLKKVNECAQVYGWDDKTTVHYAMQKLQGLAKTWYESLDSILFTWQEWQNKLLTAFPCEENFGQSLENMLRRKSRFSESIEVYYYEKLALLNQCEITGKKAVDCIIHGLSDRTMKSSALALRCTMPEQLLQFLLSNRVERK